MVPRRIVDRLKLLLEAYVIGRQVLLHRVGLRFVLLLAGTLPETVDILRLRNGLLFLKTLVEVVDGVVNRREDVGLLLISVGVLLCHIYSHLE